MVPICTRKGCEPYREHARTKLVPAVFGVPTAEPYDGFEFLAQCAKWIHASDGGAIGGLEGGKCVQKVQISGQKRCGSVHGSRGGGGGGGGGRGRGGGDAVVWLSDR